MLNPSELTKSLRRTPYLSLVFLSEFEISTRLASGIEMRFTALLLRLNWFMEGPMVRLTSAHSIPCPRNSSEYRRVNNECRRESQEERCGMRDEDID